MLQKLEKEIDDADAKIGDRWRLRDRYVVVMDYASYFIVLICSTVQLSFYSCTYFCERA